MASAGECCLANPVEIWRDVSYPHLFQFPQSPLVVTPSRSPHPNSYTSPSSPTLQAEAASIPPGYSGCLSLHDYRKYLSRSGEYRALDHLTGKKLKRKHGAANLNQAQACLFTSVSSLSVSSATSSPPPLSPSYSQSVVSQRSELDLDNLGIFLPPALNNTQQGNSSGEHGTDSKQDTDRLHPFRERLKRFPTAGSASTASHHDHGKSSSDSYLLNIRASKTIVSHHGALFEILNPRESWDLARIVSLVEDVDRSSVDSTGNQRDSFLSAASMSSISPEHDVKFHVDQQPGDPWPYYSPDPFWSKAEPEPPQWPEYYATYSSAGPDEQFEELSLGNHSETNDAKQRLRPDIVGDEPARPFPSIDEVLEHAMAADTSDLSIGEDDWQRFQEIEENWNEARFLGLVSLGFESRPLYRGRRVHRLVQ